MRKNKIDHICIKLFHQQQLNESLLSFETKEKKFTGFKNISFSACCYFLENDQRYGKSVTFVGIDNV